MPRAPQRRSGQGRFAEPPTQEAAPSPPIAEPREAICGDAAWRALTRPARRGHARREGGPRACAPGNRRASAGTGDPGRSGRPARGWEGARGRGGSALPSPGRDRRAPPFHAFHRRRRDPPSVPQAVWEGWEGGRPGGRHGDGPVSSEIRFKRDPPPLAIESGGRIPKRGNNLNQLRNEAGGCWAFDFLSKPRGP